MRSHAIKAVVTTSRALNAIDKQLLRLWWALLTDEDRRDCSEPLDG